MSSVTDLRAQFEPSARTVPEMLRRQATRHGDRRLFVCGGTAWSYAQVVDIAAHSGGRFAVAGIAQGDRVAILCGNRPEFIELFLGCAWIGAVSVPINVAARGAPLEHMLNTSGARLLILEHEWLSALGFVDFSKLAVEALWVIDAAADAHGEHQGIVVRALPKRGSAVPAADLQPHDLLTILF